MDAKFKQGLVDELAALQEKSVELFDEAQDKSRRLDDGCYLTSDGSSVVLVQQGALPRVYEITEVAQLTKV